VPATAMTFWTPMRDIMVEPFSSTTSSMASTAACHSAICCSAAASFWIYFAASLRVTSWRPRGRGMGSSNGRSSPRRAPRGDISQPSCPAERVGVPRGVLGWFIVRTPDTRNRSRPYP
jgi:hypothetical protein